MASSRRSRAASPSGGGRPATSTPTAYTPARPRFQRVLELSAVLLLAARPLACAAALRRAPPDRSERLWVGWFGVRGVGSIYDAAAAIGSGLPAPTEDEVVIWTVAAVVMTSILVHGVTADPLSRRLGLRRATPER